MFNARERLARGVGASSNVKESSHDSPYKMSRLRGRGKQQDNFADAQMPPSVSFGQVETNSIIADIEAKADLKASVRSPPKLNFKMIINNWYHSGTQAEAQWS